MKRYEINYLAKNEYTHLIEPETIAIYGDRKEFLATLKEIKKDYTILNTYKVNNNEIYTKLKY